MMFDFDNKQLFEAVQSEILKSIAKDEIFKSSDDRSYLYKQDVQDLLSGKTEKRDNNYIKNFINSISEFKNYNSYKRTLANLTDDDFSEYSNYKDVLNALKNRPADESIFGFWYDSEGNMQMVTRNSYIIGSVKETSSYDYEKIKDYLNSIDLDVSTVWLPYNQRHLKKVLRYDKWKKEKAANPGNIKSIFGDFKNISKVILMNIRENNSVALNFRKRNIPLYTKKDVDDDFYSIRSANVGRRQAEASKMRAARYSQENLVVDIQNKTKLLFELYSKSIPECIKNGNYYHFNQAFSVLSFLLKNLEYLLKCKNSSNETERSHFDSYLRNHKSYIGKLDGYIDYIKSRIVKDDEQ